MKKETATGGQERLFCQSCGMPIDRAEDRGTEADGTLSEEYCIYCYKDGAFAQNCTMEQMIAHCADMVDEFNRDSEIKYTWDQAIEQMRKFFPELKRWKPRP